MEMFKNMEVVLVLCFGLICWAAIVAQPSAPDATARAQGIAPEAIPVVVVTGKRLSAAEKARSMHGSD
jgi:hypothetical protein